MTGKRLDSAKDSGRFGVTLSAAMKKKAPRKTTKPLYCKKPLRRKNPMLRHVAVVEETPVVREDITEDLARLPFLDFFAGSGLVTEALRHEFRAVWANDNSRKKAEVYRVNHGSDHFDGRSVEDVGGDDVPDAVLSWASFPCQDLSLAGNLDGIHGERSGLIWHCCASCERWANVGHRVSVETKSETP